ncbi:Fanconi-associated nuclease 1 [Hordeum vulgare]|nr:Fanconi-associated nuclease 1 [Hordeum vulgare]
MVAAADRRNDQRRRGQALQDRPMTVEADDAGAGMGEAEGEAAVVAPSLSGGSAGSERVACPVCRGRTSVGTDASPNADSSTTLAVKTVIVGQRFRENFKLQEGMSITILKDPQNAKEPDAVKGLIVGRCLGPQELYKQYGILYFFSNAINFKHND